MKIIRNMKIEEYIFYLSIIIFSAQSANFLENKIFLILLFSYTFILYFKKFKNIDPPVFIILFMWFLINGAAYIEFGNVYDVAFISFLSVTARMVYPFFILKIVGPKIFKDFERIIFILTLISLPIFAAQLLFPDVFSSLAPYLNGFTIEEQQIFGGWYIGIYMYSGWAFGRNCGFMWEPGAFTFMIIIATLFRLSQHSMKIDRHVIVYLVAIATTFSTMGYIVFTFILLAQYIQKKNIFVYVLFIPLFMTLAYMQYWELEFIGPKIAQYYADIGNIYRSSVLAGSILRVNRFDILVLAFKESLKWPIGYGIFENTPFYLQYAERVSGPNTYAQILLRWGWIGIIIFIYAAWKYIKHIFRNEAFMVKGVLYISLLASVSSYSLLNNSILLVMLYYPFISMPKETHINQKNKINNQYEYALGKI